MDPVTETSDSPAQSTTHVVLRNAMFLVAAKVLATPISVVTTAVMARYLGPEDYGHQYLASTFCGFGFLLVTWGQGGVIPRMIAQDRSKASELLGVGLAWRLLTATIVYAVLAAGSAVLGYTAYFQVVLLLVVIMYLVNAMTSACQDVVRGFERTDLDAISSGLSPFLGAAVAIPILLLGGRLRAVLIGEICVALGMFALIATRTRAAGVRLSFARSNIKVLFVEGYPFVFFGLVMALQPNIDAVFLSKLAPTEVVGWLAASRRLIGLLVFPASALITALYPSLCRLFKEDMDGFARATRSALQTSTLLVIPAAFCCGLFPDVGIAILGEDSFGPAEDNLRVFAVFIFLVYFSMPLGSAVLAAGRQRAWALVQLLCVAVSVVLDPLLIPLFQDRVGNGGLGVCVATVASEVLMVGFGIYLTPPGVFDRATWRTVLLALLGGGAMTAIRFVLPSVTSFVVAPLALAAYVGVLWMTGGLTKSHLASFRQMIRRKAAR